MNIFYIILGISILVFNIFVVCKFIKTNMRNKNIFLKIIVFFIGLKLMAFGENQIFNVFYQLFN